MEPLTSDRSLATATMLSFTLFLILCVLFYYYLLNNKYSYWRKMGVNGPIPLPIVGNFGKLMLMQQSIGELARVTYVQNPGEKFVGLYCGFRKAVLIRDPDTIKDILTKDFKYFMSRGLRTTDTGFCNNLLVSEGDIWKTLRKKLTPAFTATKIKRMTPLVQECVNKFLDKTELYTKKGGLCDIKDLSDKYSLDLIASCFFGLGLDAYSDESKQLRKVSKCTQPTIVFWLWYAAEMVIPGIQAKLTRVNPGSYFRRFFMHLVNTIITERETRGIKRIDLMNIMIDMREQDKLKRENSSNIVMDDITIASQAFAFYIAGQETTSSILSFLLYELSLNPEVQDRAHQEICQVLDKHNGDLTYDAVKEMNYLYMAFRETLRKHPGIGFLIRKCTSDYIIPETKIQIKSDTLVLCSISGLHNDAKYFPNPDIFNPENFSEENSNKIPHYAYLPFGGSGPRNCIGSRFAEIFILLSAASFLRVFMLKPCNDNKRKIRYNNCNSFTETTIGGLWVNVIKR